MPENKGLVGIRPKDNDFAKMFVAPPYDVITYGTPLQEILSGRENLIHSHLRPKEEGDGRYANAKKTLDRLVSEGKLVEDNEPAYYVYRQVVGEMTRIGVLLACKVTDYSEGKVIRHEKTFDDKVKDRMNLRKATGYQIGVVFSVMEDKKKELLAALEEVSKGEQLYSFSTDFEGTSDMDGIKNDVWRVPGNSELGGRIKSAIESEPAYIADGHHRYHCAVVMEQKYLQMYISPSASAKIQAYDRVVGSVKKEDVEALPEKVKDEFDVSEHGKLEVPDKHSMIFYFRDKILMYTAKPELLKEVEADPVAKLDCSLLQDHLLFPHLGLSTENIKDKRYFYYLPGNESGFSHMKKLVDGTEYEFAVSLAPVEFSELKAVADIGVGNPEIVMPQKSTYFWPKLLSGLFIYEFE
ncbi:MAG: DUF1015 domain-containing protein [Candidatus Micrarchaeota archaeon]